MDKAYAIAKAEWLDAKRELNSAGNGAVQALNFHPNAFTLIWPAL